MRDQVIVHSTKKLISFSEQDRISEPESRSEQILLDSQDSRETENFRVCYSYYNSFEVVENGRYYYEDGTYSYYLLSRAVVTAPWVVDPPRLCLLIWAVLTAATRIGKAIHTKSYTI